mmetsp:Transcript_54067/g.113021  ORF Transcript_54067/g.113021 Transcript_54067/m.113021 type:complete len:94 (+) Transcript_54067:2264-2545(+)
MSSICFQGNWNPLHVVVENSWILKNSHYVTLGSAWCFLFGLLDGTTQSSIQSPALADISQHNCKVACVCSTQPQMVSLSPNVCYQSDFINHKF